MNTKKPYVNRLLEIARNETIQCINRAFQDVSRGTGVTLHEADVIDGYGNAVEREKAHRLDVENTWQGVPAANIERYEWILTFLDAKGLHYYLPTYMNWSLRNFDNRECSPDSVTSTLYALKFDCERASDGTPLYQCDSKFHRFSAEQLVACASFIYFLAVYDPSNEEEAKSSMNAGWLHFLPERLRDGGWVSR